MLLRKTSKIIKEIFIHIILLIVGAVMIFPFLWMVCTGLKGPTEVLSWPPILLPKNPIISNFVDIFAGWPFHRFFLNSIVVASISTLSILLTSTLAGYAFAKIRFFGRGLIFFIILATAIVPFEAYMIPVYLFISKLKWNNTYPGLIAPFLVMSYGIFFMRQNIYAIPDELIDAARVDGCSEFRIYWQIIIPLSVSAISALAIFAFMNAWGYFVWPLLVVSTKSMYTTELGLALFQHRFVIEYGLIMAASALCVIPVLVVFFIFQRQIVKGITLTGLKG